MLPQVLFKRHLKTDFVYYNKEHTLFYLSNKTIGSQIYQRNIWKHLSKRRKPFNLCLVTAHLEKHRVKEVRSTKVENGMEPFIILLIAQIKNGILAVGKSVEIKAIGKEKEMPSAYEGS